MHSRTHTIMPGRILGFGGSNPSSSKSPAPKPRRLSSSEGKNLAKISSTQSTMDHVWKSMHGVPGMGKNRDKSREKSRDKIRDKENRSSPSPSLRPTKPTNKLEMTIESPPNIFYGNPTLSSGALLSGQLRLVVTDPDLTLETFTMELVASIKTLKPVSHGCPECTVAHTTLNQWTFIKEPKHLAGGQHLFPFSYLLPGHLPATTHGYLGDLEYALQAKATSKRVGGEDKALTLRHPLEIYRALAPAPDKNSLRIFPPTNLTAHVTLCPIIHPIGDFPVVMRISGLTDKQKDIQVRWRLRKMSWKLEEMEKLISPACPRHAHKVGGEGKGVQHEDVRTLGYEERKDGWKTDFSDGSLEMEFSCRPLGVPRPLCDVSSPTGMAVTHNLVVELVVAEEWAPNKKPDQATPTGAARVLRMQFTVMVTERSGMGISWDEEQPPMYEDVPASPPMYPRGELVGAAPSATRGTSGPAPGADAESATRGLGRTMSEIWDYTGPPLDEPHPIDDMERLSLGPAIAGPSSAAAQRRPPRARGRFSLDDFEVEDRRRREEEERERGEEEEEEVAAGDVQ